MELRRIGRRLQLRRHRALGWEIFREIKISKNESAHQSSQMRDIRLPGEIVWKKQKGHAAVMIHRERRTFPSKHAKAKSEQQRLNGSISGHVTFFVSLS